MIKEPKQILHSICEFHHGNSNYGVSTLTSTKQPQYMETNLTVAHVKPHKEMQLKQAYDIICVH